MGWVGAFTGHPVGHTASPCGTATRRTPQAWCLTRPEESLEMPHPATPGRAAACRGRPPGRVELAAGAGISPEDGASDAQVSWWVVDDHVGSPLGVALDAFVARWLREKWTVPTWSYLLDHEKSAPRHQPVGKLAVRGSAGDCEGR